jgi:hypothetical protein
MENLTETKKRGRKIDPNSARQAYLKAKAERDVIRAKNRAARERLVEERKQRRQERDARKAARVEVTKTQPKKKSAKTAA